MIFSYALPLLCISILNIWYKNYGHDIPDLYHVAEYIYNYFIIDNFDCKIHVHCTLHNMQSHPVFPLITTQWNGKHEKIQSDENAKNSYNSWKW